MNKKERCTMSDLKPLHIINVFIEPWFRQEIINTVLEDFSIYPDALRKELVETLKSEVKVSGFRNPLTAPKRLLAREIEKLFEKDPHFIGIIIRTWMCHYEKKAASFEKALKSLKFEISEQANGYPDALNAFGIGWPEGVDYQKVIETVRKQGDKLDMTDDQIVLYSILKTGYLPGEKEE